jgi:pilus assembly protein CpaE
MSTIGAKLHEIEAKPLVVSAKPDAIETSFAGLATQTVVNSSGKQLARLNLPERRNGSLPVRGSDVQIYFFGGAIPDGEQLERSLRKSVPQLEHIDSLEQLQDKLLSDRCYLLFPFSDASIDQLIDLAAKGRDDLFFIFIGDEIAASDYKRLVRTGQADWVSARGAQQEILDVIAQHKHAPNAKTSGRGELVVVSFLPSGGGVGNATLAVETAVQLKTHKATKGLSVCLVDLDFQTGHVCDLLDIDARLKVAEISHSPERLDAQLMDLFVSHHPSGLDVVAAPRSKDPYSELSIAALDALFAMLSQRYDIVLVDLPVHWFGWTRQILSASNLTIVTGSNTIPGLRQVVDAVKTAQGLDHPPAQVAVVLNRCKHSLFGGVVGRRFVKRVLVSQRVFYVREDAAAAKQSANTGVPVSIGTPLSRISKDVAKLGALVGSLRAGALVAAE